MSTADGVGSNNIVGLSSVGIAVTGALPVNAPITWQVNSFEYVDRFEVSLGTAPGDTDVVDWIQTDSQTTHTFTGLSLIECQNYYPSLRILDINGEIIEVISDSTGFYWDNTPPPAGTINVAADDALFNESITTTFTPTIDNCSGNNITYEYAIGTTPSGNDILDFHTIADTSPYRAIAGVNNVPSLFNLVVGVANFSTIRATDEAGLFSDSGHTIFGPWYYGFAPNDLPNMVVWLDSSDNATIFDGSGRDADNALFDNQVTNWNDKSGSTNVHNFNSVHGNPNYIAADNSMNFSGGQCFTAGNHNDLNTATVNQRNITTVFETGPNVSTRQVVYEEGGGVRGMNIYISSNLIRCGFYNTVVSDGDGVQGFVEATAPIAPSQRYSITWVFDYTNYTGPSGVDGTLTCYLNGVQMGTSISTTSRLFGHSGRLGVGCKNNDTYFSSGASSGDGDFFTGKIFEVMLFNDPPTPVTVSEIFNFLSGKWGI